MGKNVTKGENACYKQFLLFSQCFLPYITRHFHFKMHVKMSSAIRFNLDQSKSLSSGKELKEPQESTDRCTDCRDITEILLETIQTYLS